ncbi:MAG: helix-turn-helix transcriptional regulator [Paenibacillaceae bacterium]|nr:helix-turn-helix transcriptional regulator [Paenibacillaceae bacterium]
MIAYEGIGPINLKVRIGNIVFDVMLNDNFFNDQGDFFAAKHNHAAFEAHFMFEGSGVLQIGQEQITLSPDSLCIIGPGIYHTQKASEQGPIRKYCLRFDYCRSSLADADAPPGESAEIVKLLERITWFAARDEYGIRSLITDIHAAFRERSFGYYARLQSLFALLLLNILRSVPVRKEMYTTFRVRTPDDERSETIEQFFAKHYDRAVTPRELAANLAVSHSQLNRILWKNYRMSFKRKLLETRMEIAKDMLANSQFPVTDIAAKVGYGDVSNFSNAFKAKTGVSPTSYREERL